MLEEIEKFFGSDPGLERLVQKVVTAQQANQQPPQHLDDLLQQRERGRSRTNLLVTTLDEATLADAKAELDQLRIERSNLDAAIAVAQAQQQMAVRDPQQVARDILARLRQFAASARQMPTFELRRFLQSVIGSAVVDLETKTVELRLILPLQAQNAMRLEASSASSAAYQTHQPVQLPLLATVDCHVARLATAYCCQRRAAWERDPRPVLVQA